MSPIRKSATADAVATPFEPGAKTAPDSPVADLSRPLDTVPGADHFAAVEERRIEMLHEMTARIAKIKARSAELMQQANEKQREWRYLSPLATHAGDQNKITALRAEEEALVYESRRLINQDLPQLENERSNVGSGNHPTLAVLRIAAQNRVAADMRAKRPEQLPSFVVLEAHFGFREGEQLFNFAEGQMIRDPDLIGKLLERNAPLSLGA